MDWSTSTDTLSNWHHWCCLKADCIQQRQSIQLIHQLHWQQAWYLLSSLTTKCDIYSLVSPVLTYQVSSDQMPDLRSRGIQILGSTVGCSVCPQPTKPPHSSGGYKIVTKLNWSYRSLWLQVCGAKAYLADGGFIYRFAIIMYTHCLRSIC